MRRARLLLSVIILVLFSSLPSGAVAAEEKKAQQGYDLLSDLSVIFPEERIQEAKANGYDVQYSKYKPSRYHLEFVYDDVGTFDVKKQSQVLYNHFLNNLNNVIWQIVLTWDFTVITAVEKSFSLDIVDAFADAVEKAVQALAGFNGSGFNSASGVWGNFLLLFIICAGAYIAYLGMIKKKTTDAIGAMVKSVVILMLAMVFFANSGGIMKYLNDLSSGLSQEVMGVGLSFNSTMTNEVKYPEEVASFVVADKLYHMLVYQPYLLLQYGKPKEDGELTKKRIDSLLNTRVESTARENVLKNEQNNLMMTEVGVSERLILLALLVISHLILGFVFLIIAGAVLVYQFLFIIFALYAPFAFLMALYPTWSQVATNWLKKFVGYQLTKLLLGIFLSILVTLSQFLYEMAPPDKFGYIWTITMQLILVVGVIWKRQELFSILSTPLKVDSDTKIRNLLDKLTMYAEKPVNYAETTMKKLNVRK